MAVTITEFLEARITEDEEVVRLYIKSRGAVIYIYDDGWLGYADGEWDDGTPHLPNRGAEYTVLYDPARVLAECAAKRAIMSHFVETVKWSRDPDCPAAQSYSDIAVGLGESLHHLAAVYADHPDYRQEWAA